MAKNVTINTVAEQAGVSRGTVDRVLNQRPHVKPDVYERVVETMRELNYIPPHREQAEALGLQAGKETEIIYLGVVLPNWQGYFRQEILRGIQDASEMLKPKNTEVLVETCETALPDECLEKIDQLLEKGVSGIALCTMDHDSIIQKIHRLWEDGIPVVTFNSDIQDSDRICYVGQDVIQSGRVAGELMSRYLRPEDSLLVTIGNYAYRGHRQRMQGFCQRLHEDGFDNSHFEVLETYNDYTRTYMKVRESLERMPEIRGIYMANESVMGCVEAVRSAGAQDRILIVCHDLTEENKRFLARKEIGFVIAQDIHGDGIRALTILREYVREHFLPESTWSPIDIICGENLRNVK